jgi:LPS O-antigen subunit length determinant protein (WzzB/FepE family)
VNSQLPTTPGPENREGEINLIELLRIFVGRKIFICGLTLFVTILAVVYTLYTPPIYLAKIQLKAPPESSVLKLKHLMGIDILEKQQVYTAFLDNVFSGKIQKETFVSKKYFDRFKFKNKNIPESDIFFNSFVKTIKSDHVKREQSLSAFGDYYEVPLEITMTGEDPEIISDFLNDLSDIASKNTIDEFLAVRKELIQHRLQLISEEIKLLINKSTQDRLSKIIRMKSLRDQEVRLVNKKITELQVKEKNDRAQKIEDLSYEMEIASALNIADNNFSKTTGRRTIKEVTSFPKSFFKKDKDNEEIYSPINLEAEWAFPKWYLFGERALKKEIESLKQRNDNNFYNAEIATLRLKLETNPLNEKIKTLEQRKNESPYINKFNELNLEFETLSAIKLNPIGIDVAEISRRSVPLKNPIGYKKLLIVSITFIAGLLLSMLIAVILSTKPRSQ